MTNVERTNIEVCLKNISNLVKLKTALEISLSHTSMELDYQVENLGLEEHTIEAIDISNNSACQLDYDFKDIMTRTIENILDCWK